MRPYRRAQRHRRARRITAGSPHDAGAADTAADLDVQVVQLRRDDSGGVVLGKRQLGVGVQIAPQRPQPVDV